MDRMQLLNDLFIAYFEARRHKRNTINQLRFEIDYETEIFKLAEEILSHSYKPRPSICFIVDDPVKREIFAADFRDRVIHHLIFNYIAPLFDKQFIDDSYSCRKGKGTHYGIRRVADFIKKCSQNYTRDCYVLKLDVCGYFMNIDKKILLQKIGEMLYGKNVEKDSSIDHEMVNYLIRETVANDPRVNCIFKGKRSDWNGLPPSKSLFYSSENCGLPIGNLTSQLFSNVYLHFLDCFMKDELGLTYYGRYVDDFVVVHPDKDFLRTVILKVREFLKEELHLELHPRKIYLQHYAKGVAFLGVYIKPYRICIGKHTRQKFKGLLRAGLSDDPQQIRASLNSYLGIMQHYATYNFRRKMLLGKSHVFFRYGYLDGKLKKYVLYRGKPGAVS